MSERILAGTLDEENVEQTVLLKGWVQKRRDLGGLIFIDLRDRTGVVQVVFNPDHSSKALEIADSVRSEYVIEITGEIVKRDEKTVNPLLKTGTIEVLATDITVLNKAKTPPFMLEDETDVAEELRLKYRYMDLRRAPLQETFKLRHQTTQVIRNFLNDDGFLEMETPILTKSTPEGARDYLVPSRLHPGEFYALPQSPQLFKQLIMVAGYDRYFQICRCFRDEDLRADRQPEFTQIDMEMTFVEDEDVIAVSERMIARIWKEIHGVDLPLPLPRMTYAESMRRFGVDNPDLRFGLEIQDISELVKNSEFGVFSGAVEAGGVVRALAIPDVSLSRKQLDGYTDIAKNAGLKGLAWDKVTADGWSGPIAKFFSDEERAQINQALQAQDGATLLFAADNAKVVAPALGALRKRLGADLELNQTGEWKFTWITEFPLLEHDDEAGRWVAVHHPFTAPRDEDLQYLDTDPGKVRAKAYDLVLNGNELGGGSIRSEEHTSELQ